MWFVSKVRVSNCNSFLSPEVTRQYKKKEEAATRGVLKKQVFFEISQNSQKPPVSESLF